MTVPKQTPTAGKPPAATLPHRARRAVTRPRNRFTPAVFLAAAVLCTACESPEQETPGAASVTDSAGIRIVTTSNPRGSDATCTLGDEPVFRLGEEGDDENLWFSQVGGIGRLSDGSIALVDEASSEVRLFSEDGRHLWTAGGFGEGPGEFDQAWYLWVLPGDTLWVGNIRPWHYKLFTREGEFVRAVERVTPYGNPTRGGGVLDNGVSINGSWRSSSPRNFTTPDTLVLEAHDRDAEFVRTVARLAHRVYGTTRRSEALQPNTVFSMLFSARAMAHATANTIAVGDGRDTEVRLLDGELRLRRIVRWSESGREVTSADVKAYRDDYLESRGGRDSEEWRDDDELQIDPDRPTVDVFPAFTSIMVGRDDRLWVLPYQKPGKDPRAWMAFGPDGTFHCHLARTKPDFTVREFGAGYALGVEEGDLGVQSVVMYRLSGGDGGP